MADNALTILGLGTLGDLGLMAFLTILVVETLKQIIPKKFPTALLTLIVALIIAVILPITASGIAVTSTSILASILNGFIVAFISMNGFDSLKKLWIRIRGNDGDNNE